MRYHTVIIGAGLSGLAAGIRLAYFDRPVCILERHTTIGGLNSFYRLRGRNYDVGLHAVTNYAPPGTKTGPLAKLLKQLRLRWDDFDLSPQIGSAVAFPDVTLRFDNDFEFFRSEVASRFPEQTERFERLLKHIDETNELDLDQEPVSARRVVQSFLSDPLLEDMIFCPLMFYGSAVPRDMDFNQFVIMFKSIFQQGFARPFAGVRLILKNLVRHYKSLGGELRLRAGVQRIESEGGRVVGVRLDDGTFVEADHVLSSAGSVETRQLCGDVRGDAPPAPSPAGEVSFNESIFVLDRQPAELGHDETIIFYNIADRFLYEPPREPVDLRSGIICSPNNFDYGEGRQLDEGIVRITTLANPGYWFAAGDEEYVRAKQEWTDRTVEQALRFIPDFRPHVIDTDVFTPKTVKRFTGHINGCVYGAPRKVLDGRTHLDNLFLCGTDQGFLGIIGSMLSGITMANNHLLR